MLMPYKRHRNTCSHRADRNYRRCTCRIWAYGFFEGREIRQSLDVSTWDEAELELEKLNKRLRQPEGRTAEAITVARGDQFEADARDRQLQEATLRKYRYLRRDMERFAQNGGLRFLVEFNLEMLGKWRTSWPNRNIGAVKKLEFVRAFLAFAQERGWLQENPARKLKAPKVKHSPTLPYSPEEMIRIVAALDRYGIPGSRNTHAGFSFVAALVRFAHQRCGHVIS
jgi:integrase/recombinase XerD